MNEIDVLLNSDKVSDTVKSILGKKENIKKNNCDQIKFELHRPVKAILKDLKKINNKVEGYSQFSPEVFEQEGLDHLQEYNKWKEKTKHQLQNIHPGSDYKIPLKTMSVFLTYLSDPQPMKNIYIDNYSKTSISLSNEDPNFIHILWINFDPESPKYKHIIPEEVKNIPGIQFRNIKELEDHPLYKSCISILENGRHSSKLVEASDLVRVMSMWKLGGLYHDLDWKLYNPKKMIEYMKSYDFINGKEVEEWSSSIGNAFFASKAFHPVIGKLAQLIDRNLNIINECSEYVPDYIKYPEREFERIIFNTGPVAMTIAYHLAGNQDGNNDIVLPQPVVYNYNYARNHPIGDNHDYQQLKKEWEGISIETIAGDQFSGGWAKECFSKIYYDYTEFGTAP